MKRLFFILFISLSLYTSSSGQSSIDTLRYKRTGQFAVWRSAKTIAHSRPKSKLTFNKKNGQNLIYRKNGSLYLKGMFSCTKDSLFIKNGIFKYYYDNNQVRDSGSYANNKRIGLWKHFDSSGVLIFEQNHNTLVRVYYYSNRDTLAFGKMESKNELNQYEFFNLTAYNGFWEFRNVNGSCNCKGILYRSLKHGKWFYYYYDKFGKMEEIKKRYPKYTANYNYVFRELCNWK